MKIIEFPRNRVISIFEVSLNPTFWILIYEYCFLFGNNSLVGISAWETSQPKNKEHQICYKFLDNNFPCILFGRSSKGCKLGFSGISRLPWIVGKGNWHKWWDSWISNNFSFRNFRLPHKGGGQLVIFNIFKFKNVSFWLKEK